MTAESAMKAKTIATYISVVIFLASRVWMSTKVLGEGWSLWIFVFDLILLGLILDKIYRLESRIENLELDCRILIRKVEKPQDDSDSHSGKQSP